MARRSASLLKNRRVHSTSPPPGPAPMHARSTENPGSHSVNRRYSEAYSSGVKLPPQPHDSLPTPQYLTENGSRSPAASRISANVVLAGGGLQDSTHR